MAGKISLDDVLANSGVDPRILNFAIFNGYRLAHSDLTLDEQAKRLRQLHPEMDHGDVLVMLGCILRDDVAEFYNQAFPVVR